MFKTEFTLFFYNYSKCIFLCKLIFFYKKDNAESHSFCKNSAESHFEKKYVHNSAEVQKILPNFRRIKQQSQTPFPK